jgi:hypothetical protein
MNPNCPLQIGERTRPRVHPIGAPADWSSLPMNHPKSCEHTFLLKAARWFSLSPGVRAGVRAGVHLKFPCSKKESL